jgi:hypothetical protein
MHACERGDFMDANWDFIHVYYILESQKDLRIYLNNARGGGSCIWQGILVKEVTLGTLIVP